MSTSEYKRTAPAEPLELYRWGGLHPIHINDRFKDGRYWVLNKVGFGSYSTVWLARDNKEDRNVALKALVAEASSSTNQELAILEHLKSHNDPQHPGHKHVQQLLDSFYIQGPNGKHLCIVSELMGPSLFAVADTFPGRRLDTKLALKFSKQLLQAVDYIHSCGVVHGDIYENNIVFHCPEMAHYPAEQVSDIFPPEIARIARKDGREIKEDELPENLPRYQVMPLEYYDDEIEEMNEIQLVDFGGGFFVHEPPTTLHTPTVFHPPEFVFHRPLSSAVDLWQLGLITYSIVTGQMPWFLPFANDEILIRVIEQTLGHIPDSWTRKSTDGLSRQDVDSDSGSDDKLDEMVKSDYEFRYQEGQTKLKEKDLKALAHYLRRMLVVDPDRRATTKDLLQDPWVLEMDA